MKVRFIGAINGVTGSCTHFKFVRTNTEFLVDCGVSQGEIHSEAENAKDFPFEPRNLKFVLLTHGHIDHCGLIPKLYRNGFTGKVLCMAATAKIAKIALNDAVRHTNLYNLDDVNKIAFEPVDDRDDFGLSKFIPIDDHLFAGFTRTAHILGSVSITLSWMPNSTTYRKMVLSGDIGNNTKENPFQSLMGARQSPFGYPEYILTESTYGGRVRDPKYSSLDGRLKALTSAIRATFDTGDTLLIPAFSLQRTQEILFDIRHVLMNNDAEVGEAPIEVVIDSPLARKYTEIFGDELCRRQKKKNEETIYRNRGLPSHLHVPNEDAVDKIIKTIFPRNSDNDVTIPCGKHTIRYVSHRVTTAGDKKIIISGAGMCNGGPIQTYLKSLITKHGTTILLTGFMAPSTAGEQIDTYGQCIATGTQIPFDNIVFGGEAIKTDKIKAKVIDMKSYYSAHADQNGLLDFIFRVPGSKADEPATPTTVFINHGANNARKSLHDAIREYKSGPNERKIKQVEIPGNTTDWYDLDAGKWILPKNEDNFLIEILAEQRRTNELLEKLIGVLGKS